MLTLDPPALGVGLSRPLAWLPEGGGGACPFWPLPLSLDVVEPELTPLELWRTRLGEWWMFLVEPRLLRQPDLMLPVLRLAVSRQRLEASIEALTLCLLPRRTATEQMGKKLKYDRNLIGQLSIWPSFVMRMATRK